ncbi:hypothetical protein RCL1_007768 [Eukaryota sp. TZLM3-RCL]
MTKKYCLTNAKALKLALDQRIINLIKERKDLRIVNKYTDLHILFAFLAVVAGAISRWFPIPAEKDRLLKIICLVVYIVCVGFLRLIKMRRGKDSLVTIKKGKALYSFDTKMKKFSEIYTMKIRQEKTTIGEDSSSVGHFFYESGEMDVSTFDKEVTSLLNASFRVK